MLCVNFYVGIVFFFQKYFALKKAATTVECLANDVFSLVENEKLPIYIVKVAINLLLKLVIITTLTPIAVY